MSSAMFFKPRSEICFSSFQLSCSVMSDSLQPHRLQHTRLPCPSPAPELAQTHVHQVSDAIQPPHPLSSPSLPPSIFPSIRVFSSELALPVLWPKCWSFSFSISLSSEYSGLISFRMNWLDLLAVQGTLKSLLQHHSSKASILWHSAFCIVQPSHLISKVRLVKAMVFLVVMYGCESWTIKKAEHQKIDAFELWCWRRLLRVPWTARQSN